MTDIQAAQEHLRLSQSKLLLAQKEVLDAQDALLAAQAKEIQRLRERNKDKFTTI